MNGQPFLHARASARKNGKAANLGLCSLYRSQFLMCRRRAEMQHIEGRERRHCSSLAMRPLIPVIVLSSFPNAPVAQQVRRSRMPSRSYRSAYPPRVRRSDLAGSHGREHGRDDAAASWALLIVGKVKLTGRSLRGGKIRSRQSRSAGMSPVRARSIAFCVNACACPSRRTSSANVVALREPLGRPLGLPDVPFSKGLPRCFSSVLSGLTAQVLGSLDGRRRH